ncbi:MAG: transcription antitermination protein NusB, partial [Flammeovirgaceae bacterium]
LSETEHLFNKYLRLIILIGTLADYIRDVQLEKEQKTGRKASPNFSRFFNNPILNRIRTHEEVKAEKYHWEIEKIVDWSKLLRKQEEFLKVIAEAPEGLEGDKEIIKCIIRDFLFKNEAIYSYFDENDLNWNENRSVLRNMLLKTIKGIEDEAGEVDLFSLSRNWEEDKNFFEILFRNTIHEDQNWETRIAAKAKRWASDRIATIDKILLKMALSEMSCFPSIPVKVSINEYIEISKIYSTPKSWQFMNGILDAISQDLQDEGLIRKSGRGLIDNK